MWLVNYGFSEAADVAVNTEMRVKLTTITANGAFSVDSATSHTYYMGEEYKRPWAPGRLKVNYKSNGSSFAYNEQLTIRWTRRDHTSLVVDNYSSTTDYLNEDVS